MLRWMQLKEVRYCEVRPHRELFRDLLVYPKLVWYLNQIVGHGF